MKGYFEKSKRQRAKAKRSFGSQAKKRKKRARKLASLQRHRDTLKRKATGVKPRRKKPLHQGPGLTWKKKE
jgi:hypothetical protein